MTLISCSIKVAYTSIFFPIESDSILSLFFGGGDFDDGFLNFEKLQLRKEEIDTLCCGPHCLAILNCHVPNNIVKLSSTFTFLLNFPSPSTLSLHFFSLFNGCPFHNYALKIMGRSQITIFFFFLLSQRYPVEKVLIFSSGVGEIFCNILQNRKNVVFHSFECLRGRENLKFLIFHGSCNSFLVKECNFRESFWLVVEKNLVGTLHVLCCFSG